MSTNYVTKEYLIKNFQNFADKLKTIYQKQENVEFHVVDLYSKLESNPKVSMVSYVINDETIGTDIKKKGFYYYDIKEATPKWIYIEISGGNDIISLTSNVAVGAIPAGTVVNNTSAELWKKALLKNLGLLITFTGTLDKTLIYEKGVPKNTNLSVKVEKRDGSGDINTINYISIPSHGSFNGAKTSASVSLYNDTISITGLTDTQEFTVSAKDSKNTISKSTIKYEFVYPMYNILADWDSVNNTRPVVDESMIVGGTKLVAKKATQTFTLNSAGVFKVPVFAYPKTYGSLTKILDVKNGFDLISNYTKGEINITCADGQVVPYVYYIANIYSKFNDFKISFQF